MLPGLAQQNHPSRCGRIRRRLDRNRKFADSPLEEDGFELSTRQEARLETAAYLKMLVAFAFAAASTAAQLFFPAQQAGLVDDFPARRATVLAWNNSALFSASRSDLLLAGRPSRTAALQQDLRISAAIAIAGWMINQAVTPNPARSQAGAIDPR